MNNFIAAETSISTDTNGGENGFDFPLREFNQDTSKPITGQFIGLISNPLSFDAYTK
jgi:hypothetical protein